MRSTCKRADGVMKHIIATLLILALTVGSIAGLLVTPAAARIFSVQPTNEDGGPPTDQFTTADPIFAVFRADVEGGKICVVREGNPDDKRYCKTIANYVGTGWWLIAPGLPADRYQLIAYDPGYSFLSVPFEVKDCTAPDCATRRRMSDEVVAEWKHAAEGQLERLHAVEHSIHIGEIGDAFNTARELGRDLLLDPINRRYTGWAATAALAGGYGAIAFAVFELGQINVPTSLEGAFLILAKEVTKGTRRMYEDIVKDPPDFDYTTVAAPAFTDWPSTGDALHDRVVRTFERQRAFGRAQLKAYERYLGAAADGQEVYVRMQAQAVADYGEALAAEMKESAAAMRAWGAQLDPNLPAVTQEHLDGTMAVYERVRASGFTQDELNQLTSAGLGAAEIAQVRAAFDEDISQTPVGIPMRDTLARAADALEAGIPSILTFSSEAAWVADGRAPKTISLSPASAFISVGATHTVSAAVTDGRGAPVAGVSVALSVAGVNPSTLTATTDAGGVATFSYVGNNPGDDSLSATAGTATSNNATVNWSVSFVNAAPSVVRFFSTPLAEGGGGQILLDFTDADTQDTHTVTIDRGDGSPLVTFPNSDGASGFMIDHNGFGSVAANHVYAESGVYEVKATVTDNHGGVGTGAFSVSVMNLAPVLSGVTLEEVAGEVIVRADFTDLGVRDTHTAVLNWGDGTTGPGTLTEANGSGSVSGRHVYGGPGNYTITLTISDDDGGTVSRNLSFTLGGGATYTTCAVALEFNQDGVLPSGQGVVYSSAGPPVPENSVFSVSGGLLHVDSTGTAGTAWYQLLNAYDPAQDFTLEFRMQVFPGTDLYGIDFEVSDSVSDFEFGFSSSGISLPPTPTGRPFLPFDTTDGFHTYKVFSPGGTASYQFFIDGVLVANDSVSAVGGDPGQRFIFGDGTLGGAGRADIDFVRYCQCKNRPPDVDESVILTPLSDSHEVGAEHTLTATAQDAQGNLLQGRDVTFEILSGPHAGLNSTAATDAQGLAQFTYAGTFAGTDTIVARFVDSEGRAKTSNTVTADWKAAAIAPTLLTMSPASGIYGGTAGLSAHLTAGGAPLGGREVSFDLNGTSVGTATTDAGGVATISNVSLAGVNAGAHSNAVVARFAGDASHGASDGAADLTVGKATPRITWNKPGDILYGTALGDTQLNAAASVPGTFTYAPAAGTVLRAGSNQNLHVDFNPSDATNYNAASKDVSINVTKATLVVTADNKFRIYNTANPPLTFTPSGFVNGDTAATAFTGAPALATTAQTGSSAGAYPITAAIGTLNSANYSFTFVPGTLTVNQAPTTTVTDGKMFANNGAGGLTATLLDINSLPIVNRTLTLTLGTGPGSQTCSTTTDAAGKASCRISTVAQPLGPGTVSGSFAGDNNYLASASNASTLIFDYPAGVAGGSFVIGDRSAVVGKQVTFWGAQWANLNPLSGGAAPSSFKGFANRASTNPATCGGTWTTGPGNSSGPPSSIPAYMAVIVSSSITKSGSTITGNVPQIVIVKTNPGYDSNPGHAGTGTVVAVWCH